MRKIFLILSLFIFSFIYAVKPEDGSTINYTHVLFEWGAITGVDEYDLTITVIGPGAIVLDTTISSNTFLLDGPRCSFSNFNDYEGCNPIYWGASYVWEICPVSVDNIDFACNEYIFSVGSELDLGELNLTIYDSEAYYDGVTVFGNLTPAFSAAIDKDGNQIWNSGGLNTFCYLNHDKDGRLYAGKYNNDPTNILPGIEFDIDGNIIFEEPEIANLNYAFIQHEILKISDNQYLFFIPKDEYHPVPVCATTPGCTDSDGEYYWEDNFADIGGYALWRGERIILWNTDTNSIDWEWNAFDHIPLTDFDAIINWSAVSTFGYYDWTHFNAMEYDADDNAIYLSSRHLSRIYKISMETGEILWSMGYDPMGNGNVNIDLVDENGNYKGFTFQHGLQILENGNIILLDNGNISSLLFEDYNGTNYTRALEISIDENANTAEIVWEYILDESLYSALAGDIQKLDNGNYLITTIGDYGHTLEVDSDGNLISDLHYRLDNFVTGKMYRADRISSIHQLITVSDSFAGDINEDGILNILDILLTVNIVMDYEYNDLGDVNEDGVLNILDILVMVNWILNP